MKQFKLLFASLVVLLLTAALPDKRTTIFVIGDSTAANKDTTNGKKERGWAMMLQGCFDANYILVDNHAVNGRSSKSFIDEGRWDKVLEKIKPGDYVIIQFGHNDEKAKPDRHTDPGTTFDANLEKYISETRQRGGIPVLMNCVVRRNFFVKAPEIADDELLRTSTFKDGVKMIEGDTLIDTHGLYKEAPKDVARKMNCLFIDANRITHDLEQGLGREGSKQLHMWFKPGTEPSEPEGKQDNTHYNIYGATTVANLLADALCEKIPELKPYRTKATVTTVSIFRATEGTDHYANGVVMTAFQGKLYCMWQSSPKDEDTDDTWVAYSTSSDEGKTWSKPVALAVPSATDYCTSGGWLVNGNTLTAYIDLWQKGLEPRSGRTYYMTSTDGCTWSQLQPVRMADGSSMQGVLEQDPYRLNDGRLVGAAHFMPGLHVCPVYTDNPTGVSGWRKARFEAEDKGKTSREIEPSQYVRPDGTLVMLFRDQSSSFRKLASYSSDRGASFTKPVLTDYIDGRTKQCAGNLSDGTAFMVSCPSGSKARWPLVLQLSKDGKTFDKTITLRTKDELPLRRYEGRYKTLGYSYPKAFVWGNKLYIGYSVNKEDVACTIVQF